MTQVFGYKGSTEPPIGLVLYEGEQEDLAHFHGCDIMTTSSDIFPLEG